MSRIIFCIMLGLLAGGCTVDSLASNEPRNDVAPNYRAIIRAALENPPRSDDPEQGDSATDAAFFPIKQRFTNVELADSQKRTLTMSHGWAWQTCMRAKIDGLPSTLAVFTADGKIVDARSALEIDDCEKKHYVALPINRPDPPPIAKGKGDGKSGSKKRVAPDPLGAALSTPNLKN